MAYTPLQQQQQGFIGGKPKSGNTPSTPSSRMSMQSGYTPLSQAHQQFLTTKPTPKQQTQVKIATASQQPIEKPKNTNPFLSKLGEFSRGYAKAVDSIPKATFADKENFWTPKGFVKSIAQGVINTPAEALQGAQSFGQHASKGTLTPKQAAADIAAAAQLPLMLFGGPATVNIAKQGIKEGGKAIFKAIGKETAIGAGGGLVTGFQTGKDIEGVDDYVKNLFVNTAVGGAFGGTLGSVTHAVMPLAKGLSSKVGAVFVKNAGSQKPRLEKINLDPQLAQSVVLGNNWEKTPAGKEIVRLSSVAQETDSHIVITPSRTGKFTLPSGQKVNIDVTPIYNPTERVDAFQKNIEEYRSFGGATDGTSTENAALRDIAKLADDEDVKILTKTQVDDAIEKGTLKTDEEGNVVLYRGGKPSEKNGLMSTSYDREHAAKFGEVVEIKVKPSEVKAFIGKAEGEVLIENPNTRVKPEVKPKENDLFNIEGLTKEEYVKKHLHGIGQQRRGNKVLLEIKYNELKRAADKQLKEAEEPKMTINDFTEKKKSRPLNTKEVQALRTIIDDKLKVARETAKNEKELLSQIETLYKEVSEQANNDKVVLSSLRTQINKEMFNMIGAGSSNYKDAYKALQTMIKEDPELGKLLSRMEDMVKELDKKLLTAQEPARIKPVITREQKQSNGSTGRRKKDAYEDFADPVGVGKEKKSRYYQRLVDSIIEEDDLSPEIQTKLKDAEPTYKKTVLEDAAKEATRIVAETPEKAIQIAEGLVKTPDNTTANMVRKAIVAAARETEDWDTFVKYASKITRASTRYGQEIVSLRGKNNDGNPLSYVNTLITKQKEKLVKQWDKVIEGSLNIPKDATIDQKVTALVKNQATTLKKEVRERMQKTQSAQDFLNKLKCK
jgi:hypothetical protein